MSTKPVESFNKFITTPPEKIGRVYRIKDLSCSLISKISVVALLAIATAIALGGIGLLAFPSPFIYPLLVVAFFASFKGATCFHLKSSYFHKKYLEEQKISKELEDLKKEFPTEETLKNHLLSENLSDFFHIAPEKIESLKEQLKNLKPEEPLLALLPVYARLICAMQANVEASTAELKIREDLSALSAKNFDQQHLISFRIQMVKHATAFKETMKQLFYLHILKNPKEEATSLKAYGAFQTLRLEQAFIARELKLLEGLDTTTFLTKSGRTISMKDLHGDSSKALNTIFTPKKAERG